MKINFIINIYMYILGTMGLKVYMRYGFIRMAILWFNVPPNLRWIFCTI